MRDQIKVTIDYLRVREKIKNVFWHHDIRRKISKTEKTEKEYASLTPTRT